MRTATAKRKLKVGADIGGTFTDLVFVHPDGAIDKRKVPSTPSDYGRAIIEGILSYCRDRGLDPRSIDELVHATTVATNAILERKGAKTALITTEGFRDVLELRRIRIPLTYDIDWEKPRPLVEREFRYTLRERIDAAGNVAIPLHVEQLDPIIESVRQNGIEAVAVCFLHSYRQPAHERAVGEILRQRLDGTHVSLSCEVLPEMLEYERTSTTVTNAYLSPLVGRYLNGLKQSLGAAGIQAPLLVMQSNGGLISSGFAAYRPVTITESGPAAGVVAAARVAHAQGCGNVITLDMGGTTTKASIIENGAILRANEYEVGSPISVSSRLMLGSGYLLRIPVIDVSEVGAGGGSIARIDPSGALVVGPASAGAVPGPACYGRGNEKPTVTDANLVLGFLDPYSLAGGSLKIDRKRAEQALRTHIAEKCSLSVLDAAYGVHVIANSNMVRAIKTVSVERGRDPRDFVLMAFGGAGPIHAAEVARSLYMKRVLIPPAPGVFSAHGLLDAEIELHSCRTVLNYGGAVDFQNLRTAFRELREDLSARLRAEGYRDRDIALSTSIDVCYRGQSSELTIPLRDAEALDEKTIVAVYEAFEDEYERTYGHRGEKKQFEIVNARMAASVARAAHGAGCWVPEPSAGDREPCRGVYFGRERGLVKTRIIGRADLAGAPQDGPLIIQEYDATVVVPPGCRASLDASTNIVIDLDGS